ncbi:UPF0565 protein C2orf69-like protein [Trichoplax sp. H2]|nr:UPF0565 protein C2orf69-like protein [Trichoplax sp. H2]|eukprot:RDD40044.1 UPF0565 protein C2orf69-like protein [Trichoplax sp. H2]
MIKNQINKKYSHWHYHHVLEIIQKKFADSHILIIKPSRMHGQMYSCYDHFLHCDAYGNPDYNKPSDYAIDHLETIILNTIKEVNKDLRRNDYVKYDLPTVLIGFSKGCVVLNQLILELSNRKKCISENACDTNINLFKRIAGIHWLDGGHSGENGTWLTNEGVINDLVSNVPLVCCHVTPYQMMDGTRPWVYLEYERFVQLLNKSGGNIKTYNYFMDKPRSIDYHFNLLEAFLNNI